jgi:hypothetical protein
MLLLNFRKLVLHNFDVDIFILKLNDVEVTELYQAYMGDIRNTF